MKCFKPDKALVTFLCCVLWLTAAATAVASELTDSLRRSIHQAAKANDVAAETLARERLIVNLYNELQFDTLLAELPESMEFYKQQQDWEHYYYMWRIQISAYLYSERNNTALHEVRKMYADAQQRNNDYGIAMASHVMGLAYSNMHYYEEAQKAIERSLKIMTSYGAPFMQVSMYGDYCEVLSARKDWEALLPATKGWHSALLAWGHDQGMTIGAVDSTVFATYCFVSQAQAQRGLGHYAEAERLLRLATRNAKLYGDSSNEGHWHHVAAELAEFHKSQGDYAKALAYNDELMYWMNQRNVDTEQAGIEQQRAEILMALGRYKEASELWRKVHEISEEHNLKDAKNQLSEMNSLFQLGEMEVAQQKARTRYIVIIASLIVIALVVMSLLRWLSARRLAAKNRELAIALAHAQESDQMKIAFIRHVTHEVRTPLNIITGFTQVLNTPGYSVSQAERTDMLNKIGHNTQLIVNMVNELLELSQSETCSEVKMTDEVTVGELCSAAVKASGIAPTPQVDFRIDNTVSDHVKITTNTESVTKVLVSLIDNAVKFTPQGSITLLTEVSDGLLHFYIIDTGTGIPKEAQKRIFERFEKVDAFQAGIGLGLNVARTVARRLGGEVVLMRSDGSGSTFLFTLPLHHQ